MTQIREEWLPRSNKQPLKPWCHRFFLLRLCDTYILLYIFQSVSCLHFVLVHGSLETSECFRTTLHYFAMRYQMSMISHCFQYTLTSKMQCSQTWLLSNWTIRKTGSLQIAYLTWLQVSLFISGKTRRQTLRSSKLQIKS